MSVQVPTVAVGIPSPLQTAESLQQTVLALKQNVETMIGTRGAARPNSPTSQAGREISAALNTVKRMNP
jgi:hypothetical protein